MNKLIYTDFRYLNINFVMRYDLVDVYIDGEIAHNVQIADAVNGVLYCLTFEKPEGYFVTGNVQLIFKNEEMKKLGNEYAGKYKIHQDKPWYYPAPYSNLIKAPYQNNPYFKVEGNK